MLRGFIMIALVILTIGLTAAQDAPEIGVVNDGMPMSTPRAAHSATPLEDGTVLIAGGMVREHNNLTSAELYDPDTGTFAPTGDLITARVSHTATLLQDGRVLLVGGWEQRVLASAELYDRASGTFAATGAMSIPRSAHTATLLPDGQVLVAGGFDNSRMVNSAELYNPETGQFIPASDLNAVRTGHTATLLEDGRVLIAGGRFDDRVYDSAELYDYQTGRFTMTGSMLEPRHKHAAALLPDGRVLIIGGADERDWRGRSMSAEIYDPQTGIFSAADDMEAGRVKHTDAIAVLDNGMILVAGGSTTVELYNPLEARFEVVRGSLDASRFFTTATRLLDGSVLIVGGYDGNIIPTDATWIFRQQL
jgi:hypothetical protein